MQLPNILNVAQDSERNITFNVMAYQKLSEPELLTVLRNFRLTKQGRRLKKNTTYTIYWSGGSNGRFDVVR